MWFLKIMVKLRTISTDEDTFIKLKRMELEPNDGCDDRKGQNPKRYGFGYETTVTDSVTASILSIFWH